MVSANLYEIFYSLQGEVPGIGIPSIFIRLSGCSLSCAWCDSKYASNGIKTECEDILDRIDSISMKGQRANHIIFTGGEPTLQMKALSWLIPRLIHDFKISIETNGTKKIDRLPYVNLLKYVAVSPKFYDDKYADSIHFYSELHNSTFKIVHTTDDEVLNMISDYEIPHDKVVIMPLGASRKELRINTPKTWQFCMDHGFRMGYRLHIEVHDMKRGV